METLVQISEWKLLIQEIDFAAFLESILWHDAIGKKLFGNVNVSVLWLQINKQAILIANTQVASLT